VSTVQAIVDLARVNLQDGDPDAQNWSDTELAGHVLAGVRTAFVRAPQLFFGLYDTMPPASLALTDPCPLSPEYDHALADYTVARAHLKDDEDARDAESQPFIQLFLAEIGA
jgi:hypothetical protein